MSGHVAELIDTFNASRRLRCLVMKLCKKVNTLNAIFNITCCFNIAICCFKHYNMVSCRNFVEVEVFAESAKVLQIFQQNLKSMLGKFFPAVFAGMVYY